MTAINSEDQTALDVVRLCYDEPTRNLHFRIGFHDLETACEGLRIIDSYNDFDGVAVAAALTSGLSLLGERFFQIAVGREGSPVLYVSGLYDLDDAGFDDLATDPLSAHLREAKADEISIQRGTLRAWWD